MDLNNDKNKKKNNHTQIDEGFYVVRSKRPTSMTTLVSNLALTIRVYNYRDIYEENSKMIKKVSYQYGL